MLTVVHAFSVSHNPRWYSPQEPGLIRNPHPTTPDVLRPIYAGDADRDHTNALCDGSVAVFSHNGNLGLPSDSPIVTRESLLALV